MHVVVVLLYIIITCIIKAVTFLYLVLEIQPSSIIIIFPVHAAIPLVEEPSFLRLPQSLEATQGDTVQFSCKAAGKPVPSIVWYRGDRVLPGVPQHKVEIAERTEEENNSLESVLTVKDVKLNVHDGAYTAHAENEAGLIRHDAQLVGKTYCRLTNRFYFLYPLFRTRISLNISAFLLFFSAIMYIFHRFFSALFLHFLGFFYFAHFLHLTVTDTVHTFF